jgi:hypothetical protein
MLGLNDSALKTPVLLPKGLSKGAIFVSSYSKLALILITCFSVLSFEAIAQDGDATARSNTKIVEILNYINRPTSLDRCGNTIQPSFNSTTNEIDQWLSAGFWRPEIKVINASPSIAPEGTFTHKLNMTLVLFRNTGWTEDRVKAQVSRASEIYKQCGIELSEVKLVIANAPSGIIDVSYNNRDDERISRSTPESKKPIVYFVRSNAEGQTAYSWGASVEKPSRARFNTIWMTDDIDKSYKEVHDPSYNVLAHEIGHILCGCSHFPGDEKNLMAGKINLLNDRLNQTQCEVFQKSSLVEKIQ